MLRADLFKERVRLKPVRRLNAAVSALPALPLRTSLYNNNITIFRIRAKQALKNNLNLNYTNQLFKLDIRIEIVNI
jgi:hypothetical protein